MSSTSIPSSGTRGKTGWTNELAWYPNSKNADSFTFEENQKDLFFKMCEYDLSKEKVCKLMVFKTRLQKEYFDNGLETFLNLTGYAYKLVHLYVIAQTDEKFFLFAKNSNEIVVMCADKRSIDDIHENQCQGEEDLNKLHPCVAESSCSKELTIKALIEWIFDSGHISNGYDAFSNNCKDFAVALYNAHVHRSISPKNYVFVELIRSIPDSWF